MLEEAIRTMGPNEDFEHLLALTNREQAQQEHRQAEIRITSAIPKKTEAASPFAESDLQPHPEPPRPKPVPGSSCG